MAIVAFAHQLVFDGKDRISLLQNVMRYAMTVPDLNNDFTNSTSFDAIPAFFRTSLAFLQLFLHRSPIHYQTLVIALKASGIVHRTWQVMTQFCHSSIPSWLSTKLVSEFSTENTCSTTVTARSKSK